MMELVGKQDVSFTNDKGERVEGIKLHFLSEDERVLGRVASSRFFASSHALYARACALALGAFDLVYGPNNRVTDIIVPDAEKQ